jgi:hypothetical protein
VPGAQAEVRRVRAELDLLRQRQDGYCILIPETLLR